MKEIKSIFENLSCENLVKKCFHDAFHNLIWDRCPKITFWKRLHVAVYDGTIKFNDG